MMSKFFLLLLFTISITLFSQQKERITSELEIKYLYSYNTDTLDVAKRDQETMTLFLGKSSSLYISQAHLDTRKVIRSKLSNTTGAPIEINAKDLPKYKIKYSVFNNNGKVTVTSPIGKDNFTFDSENPTWNLNYKEQKKILGYTCFKATTLFNKRQYTAWYTKEISIPDGPYRFKGLPGLVMDVEDFNSYDKISIIAIEKKQETIEAVEAGIRTTRDAYIKKREEFKSNPYPDNPRFSKEQRENLIKMGKKFNNSFER